MSRELNQAIQYLMGDDFGDFTVTKFSHTKNSHAYWIVVCRECGFTKSSSASNLKSGMTTNCSKCNPRPLTIDGEEAIALCEDYINGISGQEIADKYDFAGRNLNRSYIYRVLRKNKIKPNRMR